MSLYKVVKSGRGIGLLETNTHGTIKSANGGMEWSIGKALPTVSEWCHRKHMNVLPIEDAKEKDTALAVLHPPQQSTLGYVCKACGSINGHLDGCRKQWK